MPNELDQLQADLKKIEEGLKENMADSREFEETHAKELGETKATVEKLNNDYTELLNEHKRMVDKIELIQSINHSREQSPEAERMEQNSFLRKLLKNGMDVSKMDIDELKRHYTRPDLLAGLQKNNLSAVTDAEGGATVPTTLESQIYKAVYDIPGMRNVVGARPMSSMETKTITMGAISGYREGEGEEIERSRPAFGNVTIKAHKYTVSVDMTRELLEDTQADLIGELKEAISMKFADMEDKDFINGNGVKRPNGLFANATLQTSGNYVATGVAAALNDSSNNGIDKLRLMPPTIKGVHRALGGWMMNATTAATIRNLKDDYGQYLYHQNVAAGAPPTFDGYPIYISDNCPDIAANAFPIAFGNFRGAYAIRDRVGISLAIDESERRKYDEVVLYARKRTGGEPIITETPAVVLLKVAAS